VQDRDPFKYITYAYTAQQSQVLKSYHKTTFFNVTIKEREGKQSMHHQCQWRTTHLLIYRDNFSIRILLCQICTGLIPLPK